jgi:hypothetical protein
MGNLDELIAKTERRLVGLDVSKLPDGIESYVADAVEQHSANRPRTVVEQIEGDGTDEYEFPETWSDGFSVLDPVRGVRRVPAGDFDSTAAEYVRGPDGYRIERDSENAPQLRLSWTPGDEDLVVLEYTAPHVVDEDGSTLDLAHVDAVAALAAALVLDAKLLGLADLSLEGADVDLALGDISGRGGLLERRAKALRAEYEIAVGISGPAADAQQESRGAGLRTAQAPNDWRWGNRRPY